jgi:hypothetical protein
MRNKVGIVLAVGECRRELLREAFWWAVALHRAAACAERLME